MYRIKEVNEEKFQKYLDQAIKLKEEGLKNEKIFKFWDVCYVLASLIERDIKYPTISTDVIEAILISDTPRDTTSFLDKLNEKLAAKGPTRKFYFVATCNIDTKSLDRKNFTLDGAEMRLLSYDEAENIFVISKALSNLYEVKIGAIKLEELKKYSYSTMEIESPSAENAFWNALSHFELFRGLVNFAHYYSKIFFSYELSMKPKVLSIFQPARIYVIFDEDKNFINYWTSFGFFDYPINRLDDRRSRFLMELINKVNSLKECPLKERCIFSFRKYNDGLDGNVAGTSFLEFWKIFELIALADKEERMSEIKVANRIASIFGDELSRDLLKALCDKRNYIAHTGSLPDFDQYELNIIRTYCEGAMMFLLEWANELEDEAMLNYFYDYKGRNGTDLERIKKIIDKIRELRKT